MVPYSVFYLTPLKITGTGTSISDKIILLKVQTPDPDPNSFRPYPLFLVFTASSFENSNALSRRYGTGDHSESRTPSLWACWPATRTGSHTWTPGETAGSSSPTVKTRSDTPISPSQSKWLYPKYYRLSTEMACSSNPVWYGT
jgi:hypothetical protein